jgi:2'-5' RNA ligase
MSRELLRLFIAVTLPDDVRERLARSQEALRAAQADVSWVKPDNLHLTVKFLGDTDRRSLARIQPALQAVAGQLGPFGLALCGLGAFGGRVPRVVWVGVSEGAAPLADLAERVDAALGRVGVPRDKRGFSAHATLGRVRSARNADALVTAVSAAGAEPFGSVAVRDFVLMQSQLNPQGSVYTVLERFRLGAEAPPG